MARLVRVSAGDLRHAVRILTETAVADGAGGASLSWSTTQRARARVQETKGKEVMFADGTKSRATHIVTMRYNRRVTPAQRVEYGGKMLEVIAPPENVEGEGVYMNLYCTAIGTEQ